MVTAAWATPRAPWSLATHGSESTAGAQLPAHRPLLLAYSCRVACLMMPALLWGPLLTHALSTTCLTAIAADWLSLRWCCRSVAAAADLPVQELKVINGAHAEWDTPEEQLHLEKQLMKLTEGNFSPPPLDKEDLSRSAGNEMRFPITYEDARTLPRPLLQVHGKWIMVDYPEHGPTRVGEWIVRGLQEHAIKTNQVGGPFGMMADCGSDMRVLAPVSTSGTS